MVNSCAVSLFSCLSVSNFIYTETLEMIATKVRKK